MGKGKKRNSRNETTQSAKVSNDQLGENVYKEFSDDLAKKKSKKK